MGVITTFENGKLNVMATGFDKNGRVSSTGKSKINLSARDTVIIDGEPYTVQVNVYKKAAQ
jgi:translation initiation factor IF-1